MATKRLSPKASNGDRWKDVPGGEERIAYHEAGHAVAYYVLGLGIKNVSIVPGDGFLGIAELVPGPGTELPSGRYVTYFEASAMICLAGLVAERIRFGREWAEGVGDDLESLGNALQYCRGSRHVYTRLVREILVLYWSEVEALASALLRCKTLPGDVARATIETSIGGN